MSFMADEIGVEGLEMKNLEEKKGLWVHAASPHARKRQFVAAAELEFEMFIVSYRGLELPIREKSFGEKLKFGVAAGVGLPLVPLVPLVLVPLVPPVLPEVLV